MWYYFNNSLARCREHQVRWYKISVLILPRWPKVSPIDFSSSVLSGRQIIVWAFFYWRTEFSCSKITGWLILWYGFVFVEYQLGLAPVNLCPWEKQIIAGVDGNWLVWWLVPQSVETASKGSSWNDASLHIENGTFPSFSPGSFTQGRTSQ